MAQLILPVGTEVICMLPLGAHPAGAVARIVHAPTDAQHAYRVQFADGSEAHTTREHLQVSRRDGRHLPDGERDFTPFIQYRCVVGSRAFGLDTAASDTDLRGFYLPPAREHWSLRGVPEQLEFGEECYWEAQKFVTLALKANPNILEVLYSPLPVSISPLAQDLLDIRHAFLSRLVYKTYAGYVLSQMRLIEADLRNRKAIRWKHAMHLLRLLISGTHLLRHGKMQVDVSEHRERLLAVKRGKLAWPELEAWRSELTADFEAAYAHTALPERPDYAAAEAWLLGARRAALEW